MSKTMPQGHSVFEGWVTHERYQPKSHYLRYKLFYLLLDLDQLDSLNSISPWWSTQSLNLVQFRRNDYLPSASQTKSIHDTDALKQAVIDVIFKATQKRFEGKVFLLTNLRYWGYCFNPVSYYFCYDNNHKLAYIVDEVTNTPWKERHQYVHECHQQADDVEPKPSSHIDDKPAHTVQFKFNKDFHVSPFMPMAMHYQTTYRLKQRKVLIHMELFESMLKFIPETNKTEQHKTEPQPSNQKPKAVFYATMNLSGQPLTSSIANGLPFRFPLQCSKIIVAIYWQALQLWLKKIPFFSHPNSLDSTK